MVALNRIIGNEKTIARLKRSVDMKEMSHAYIFEGPEGIGKKLLALEFSAMILCLSRDGDRPCGKCSSCQKIKSKNHPDLFVESPEKREYSVDEISKIQNEMRRKPNESEKKIFIVEKGERLSLKAQNKFLKTIEEPLDNVITIILVDNINRLLKTTVSRCQHLKLESIGQAEIVDYLANQGYADDKMEFIVSFADGNIGKALDLLEDSSFVERRDKVIDVIDDIILRDRTKVFSHMKFFEDEKENAETMLDIIHTWFRDMLILKKFSNDRYLINVDKLQTLKTQSEKLSIKRIYDIVKRVEDTKQDLNRNVNYQLSVEMLLLYIG